MRNRGFTLVEVLVALVLMMIMAAVAYNLLVRQQRLSRVQAQQVALQSNLRTGVLVLPGELRELGAGPSGADIQAIGPDSIVYRAMRATAFACQVSATEVRYPVSQYFGYRQPQAGRDAFYLFTENDPTQPSDDRWTALPISAVVNGLACPDGRPAVGLTTAINTGVTPLASFVTPGAPIRFYELMEFRLYASGGQNWLGARSISAGEVSLQPVLGPLLGNGMTLAYLDSTGAVTAVPGDIRSVQLTLRGISAEQVRAAAGEGPMGALQDSLNTLVTLRNTPRP